MEFLTEEHLRHAAITIAQIAFIAGFTGAIAFHFICGVAVSGAALLARLLGRSARIRAARQRHAVKAP